MMFWVLMMPDFTSGLIQKISTVRMNGRTKR